MLEYIYEHKSNHEARDLRSSDPNLSSKYVKFGQSTNE